MKKPRTSSRRAPRQRPAPLSIPPTVAVIARFGCGVGPILPDEFREAWQQMPALVTQALNGNGDSDTGTTRYGVIRAMVEQRLAESRAALKSPDSGAKRWDGGFARAVAAVDALDDDARTDIEVNIGDPAFYTGLALGLYLLSHQAPLALSAKVDAMKANTTPPRGLALAFALIRQNGETGSAPASHAARAYPLAGAIAASMLTNENDAAIDRAMDAAVDTIYPGLRAMSDGDVAEGLAAESGFYIGYAVCWLLMQQIAGGGR